MVQLAPSENSKQRELCRPLEGAIVGDMELELVSVDDDDDMNDEDRAEVLRLIDEGLADVEAGNARDFGALIESLGKRP
jgi:hypothetical protein